MDISATEVPRHAPEADAADRTLGVRVRGVAWLSPLAAIGVLLGVTNHIYAQVKAMATGWAGGITIKTTPKADVTDLSGLLWGSSAILFLVVTVAAVTVLAVTMHRSLAEHLRRAPWLWTLAALGAALLLPNMATLLPGPFGSDPYVSTEFVERVLRDALGEAAAMAAMGTVDFMWKATLSAAILVAAGACASLLGDPGSPARARAHDDGGHERSANTLRTQHRRLQAVLFAGAAVLVAGVIEMDALYHWATTVATLPGLPKGTAEAITASAIIPTGTFFSLFLAAAYVPAALILRERALELASTALPSEGPAAQGEWLQKRGLGISVSAQLTSLMALLGPVLAGGPLNALAQAFG
jgi:hypothetical protein